MEIHEIEEILQNKQTEKRFRHSIGVQYTAVCLAMRYGEDLEKTAYAGLLHDCAKHLSNEKMLEKCKAKNIDITESEYRNPFLLHAKLGAWFAEHKYGITDHEICDAIRSHTTGRPNMTLLEKIIFTADYIEPGRNQAPDLAYLRQLAFIDLDTAVMKILEQTLWYLKDEGKDIDLTTEQTYQFYKKLVENGGNHDTV